MTSQSVGVVPEFSLGDRLRKARELTGLDQGQFADSIGISRNSVSNAETGTTRPLKITLRAWALRTGVDFEWLATGHSKPLSDPGTSATHKLHRLPGGKPVSNITVVSRFIDEHIGGINDSLKFPTSAAEAA